MAVTARGLDFSWALVDDLLNSSAWGFADASATFPGLPLVVATRLGQKLLQTCRKPDSWMQLSMTTVHRMLTFLHTLPEGRDKHTSLQLLVAIVGHMWPSWKQITLIEQLADFDPMGSNPCTCRFIAQLVSERIDLSHFSRQQLNIFPPWFVAQQVRFTSCVVGGGTTQKRSKSVVAIELGETEREGKLCITMADAACTRGVCGYV